MTALDRCTNWPCAKPAGHDGPCSSSPEVLPSKEQVYRALLLELPRAWCDKPLPGRPYPDYACGECWTCRVRAALAGPPAETRANPAEEACRDIVSLCAGWDENGPTGPKAPYRWETVACMAFDYARAALKSEPRRSIFANYEPKPPEPVWDGFRPDESSTPLDLSPTQEPASSTDSSSGVDPFSDLPREDA